MLVGADAQHNVHTNPRRDEHDVAGRRPTPRTRAPPRAEDMRFMQVGLFTEVTRALTPGSRLVGGLRSDWHQAIDSRACVGGATMCPGTSPLRNDTLGATDTQDAAPAASRATSTTSIAAARRRDSRSASGTSSGRRTTGSG